MGLFTIEFELGPQTRGTVERVAAEVCAAAERVATTAALRLELGSETRETLRAMAPTTTGEAGGAREAVGDLVDKARDSARRVTGG